MSSHDLPVLFACLLACSAAAPAQDPLAARVDPDSQVAHYRRVEQELRAAAPQLDPQRAAARARAIDLLHEYWTRADFGINLDFPARRQPYFVDHDGRRCAVAFLLDNTGCGDVTERIAATANHAWVVDLVGDPELTQWLQSNGLTLAEAVRIQAPSRRRTGPPPAPPPQPEKKRPTRPARPRDTTRRPADPQTTAAPQAAGAAKMTAGTRAARGVALGDLEDTTWVPWFELEIGRWLPPRSQPAPAADNGTTGVDLRRIDALTQLCDALTDQNAAVRASATWALGQLGVEPSTLRPMLADPAREVRCAAVAALGAIDRASARHMLLHLATDPDQAQLRPLALATLAVCNGDPVADIVAAASLRDGLDPELLGAATAYARLHGNDALQQLARERLTDAASVPVRTLLAAAFGADGNDADAVVAALTRSASSRGPDARRAAAAALSRTGHALALPALLSAYELEHDIAARASLLLAIGEHGGAAARAFLLEQLDAAPKALRGWAALALGVFGRDRGDRALADAVARGLDAECNQSARGQWLLALGLLRDVANLPRLESAYADGDSLARAAVVYAYGLCGDARLLPRVATILGTDHCPFVRIAAARVIGASGDRRAVAMLSAPLPEIDTVEIRAAIAIALGATGDRAALPHLRALAASENGPVRAAALRGLGRLFATGDAQRFGRLAWRTDPTLLPQTVQWLAAMDR